MGLAAVTLLLGAVWVVSGECRLSLHRPTGLELRLFLLRLPSAGLTGAALPGPLTAAHSLPSPAQSLPGLGEGLMRTLSALCSFLLLLSVPPRIRM